MTDRIDRFAQLFGDRFSKRRRKINLSVMVILILVIGWLYWDSYNQGDRLTALERSDCKEARLTRSNSDFASCFATSDFVDKARPVEGICIRPKRVGYPCPLTAEQSQKLQDLLGVN